MNSPQKQNRGPRLPALEVEIEPAFSNIPAHSTGLSPWLTSLQNWFNRLPSLGKIAVVLGAMLMGVSLLSSVLQLVASLLSIAILVIVLYLLYQFLVSSKASQ